MSNNTSEECIGDTRPAFEAPGLLPILITLHIITLITFVIHIKAFLDRADTSHPVFAVIFHDLTVLSLCGLANILILVTVAYTHSESVLALSMIVSRLALHFHPVAWLVMTIQRYYLLVLNPNFDGNLTSLRRRSLALIWVIFLPFLLLTQGIIAYSLIKHGRPEMRIGHFTITTEFIMSGSAVLTSNIPDLASVVIYLVIWKHFKRTLATDNESPYGGIWVGEESGDSTPVPVIVQLKSDSDHKVESVLKALQWHLRLCMADLAFPALALFVCNEIIVYFMYIMHIVCFYWVPFLVIKSGFKQLNGVSEYITHIMICGVPNNVAPDDQT